ncbi:MAG: acetate/propionate family kinase [Endomicrobiales bacterium]
MKVLVVNCGSSSVKYTFFDMEGEKRLARGIIECIGLPEAYFKHQTAGEEEVKEACKARNHLESVELIIKNLLAPNRGLIRDISEISAVGHRIVHGGDKFADSVPVNEDVMENLRKTFDIAPLHNPHHYAGIEATEKLLPGVPEVVVFDTAFHQTIPDYAYIYGLPYSLYEKYHIRRYGFHGTSHKYVAQRAAKMLKRPLEELKLITCHLGNGASITAIDHGKSIDTSMGFTPLEGLVMGTRCGDIDPAIIVHLMSHETITAEGLNTLLNKKSGLYGISGLTGDMRTILNATASGSERARLALDIFCYRIKKYISSYFGVLNGADGIVFTAGVGENSPTVREKSCQSLDRLGIMVDKEANNNIGSDERFISAPGSTVKVMVVPTNEELMIAREAVRVLTKS